MAKQMTKIDKENAINYCIILLENDIRSFRRQKDLEFKEYSSIPDTDPEDNPIRYCDYMVKISRLDKKIEQYQNFIKLLAYHSLDPNVDSPE